jgi:hypothetical protein
MKAPAQGAFLLRKTRATRGRITKVTRLEPPDCGILMAMKTKNMRELEKMWAKKASEQSNPQQKAGAPTRQSPAPATRTARKASRGR